MIKHSLKLRHVVVIIVVVVVVGEVADREVEEVGPMPGQLLLRRRALSQPVAREPPSGDWSMSSKKSIK